MEVYIQGRSTFAHGCFGIEIACWTHHHESATGAELQRQLIRLQFHIDPSQHVPQMKRGGSRKLELGPAKFGSEEIKILHGFIDNELPHERNCMTSSAPEHVSCGKFSAGPMRGTRG